jgi:hypothetical protein
MRNRPRLVITCGRCGQPREGLRHVCVSNSKRRATLKPAVDLGKCGKCKKPLGNPLTHVCAPRSDFRARKARAAKREKAREREKARKKRQAEAHPPESCRDDDCPRPYCKTYKAGFRAGYEQGFSDGFGAGFDAGLASCPGPHSG